MTMWFESSLRNWLAKDFRLGTWRFDDGCTVVAAMQVRNMGSWNILITGKTTRNDEETVCSFRHSDVSEADPDFEVSSNLTISAETAGWEKVKMPLIQSFFLSCRDLAGDLCHACIERKRSMNRISPHETALSSDTEFSEPMAVSGDIDHAGYPTESEEDLHADLTRYEEERRDYEDTKRLFIELFTASKGQIVTVDEKLREMLGNNETEYPKWRQANL